MTDYVQVAIDSASVQLHTDSLDNNQYRCRLSSPLATMSRDLTVKAGYGAPTAGQFLYYYMTRVQLVNDCDDVLAWADESNKKVADPEVLAEYRQLVADLDDLKRVLGLQVFDQMMGGLAIEQAIGAAHP